MIRVCGTVNVFVLGPDGVTIIIIIIINVIINRTALLTLRIQVFALNPAGIVRYCSRLYKRLLILEEIFRVVLTTQEFIHSFIFFLSFIRSWIIFYLYNVTKHYIQLRCIFYFCTVYLSRFEPSDVFDSDSENPAKKPFSGADKFGFR